MRAAFAVFMMLAGGGKSPREAVVNETDPAITDAINDPILADPRLSLQDRAAAIGVPTGIPEIIATQTLGQIAAARVAQAGFAGCSAKIDYAFAWSARLPADLPLPAAAKVTEAAGSDTTMCKLRLVRYVIANPVDVVVAAYRKKGFTISDGTGTIRGIRATDGAAFWVSVAATPSGAAVDFVTNRGT